MSYAKNDLAINAKIYNWLFEDIEDEYGDGIDECNPAIISIVEAMKRIFKYSKEAIGVEGENPKYEPLFFLLKLFSEDSDVIYPIMKNLSIEFLRYIQYLST